MLIPDRFSGYSKDGLRVFPILFNDAPDPDPNIGKAAAANAATAERMATIAEGQFKQGQDLVARYAPVYDRLLALQESSGADNAARSTEQWKQYSDVFQPIEKQYAEAATAFGSPEEIQRREGLAAGTVQNQIESAQGQMRRNLAAARVAPDSGRSVSSEISAGNTLALAKAGAVNAERGNTAMQKIGMLQGAAQFGRNMPATGLAASGASMSGGNAALGVVGSNFSNNNAAVAPAASFYSGSVGANSAAANTLLSQYQVQSNNAAQEAGGIGSLIGIGMSKLPMFSSDENVKEDIQPVSDDAVMGQLRKIPVASWKYKDGAGDGGEHIGPMAQDVQANLGNDVAPGGTQIDPISMMGAITAGLKSVDRRLKKIETGGSTVPVHAMKAAPRLRALRI